MNNNAKTMDGGVRRIAAIGVLTALTVVTTMFTKIPTPIIHGYFNLGDTVVLIAGAVFGSFAGAFAGGVGSALADVLTGGYIFAPITFVVKAIEGYAAGKIASANMPEGRRLAAALAAGAAIMVAGYFIAEATVLRLFDETFGIGAAVAELPFNLVQGAISIALARVAVEGLKRAKIK